MTIDEGIATIFVVEQEKQYSISILFNTQVVVKLYVMHLSRR